MAYFERLPPELLLHIHFEVQRQDRVLPAPYARLCAISRVCRAWRVPAQTALFHTITPRLRAPRGTRDSTIQLLNELDRLTKRRSSLPRATRVLEVPLGVETRNCGDSTLTLHADGEILVGILAHLPNLHTLRLRLHEPKEDPTKQDEMTAAGVFSVPSLDSYRLHSLSSLRRLTVDSHLHNADPPIVGQLVRVSPRLTDVCVSQPNLANPSSCNSTKLYRDLFHINGPHNYTLLGRQLNSVDLAFRYHDRSNGCCGSDGNLSLSLYEPTDLAQLLPLRRRLLSLHLRSLPLGTTESDAYHLRSFEHLDRIALGVIPSEVLPYLVAAIPGSVRHIALIRTKAPHTSASLISRRSAAVFQERLRLAPPPLRVRFSLVELNDMENELKACELLWKPVLLFCEENNINVELRCEKDMWWWNPEVEFMTTPI